jgi:hypothetical protein
VDLTRALAADGGRLRQLGSSQSRADADRDLHGRGPLRLEVTHGSMRASHATRAPNRTPIAKVAILKERTRPVKTTGRNLTFFEGGMSAWSLENLPSMN